MMLLRIRSSDLAKRLGIWPGAIIPGRIHFQVRLEAGGPTLLWPIDPDAFIR